MVKLLQQGDTCGSWREGNLPATDWYQQAQLGWSFQWSLWNQTAAVFQPIQFRKCLPTCGIHVALCQLHSLRWHQRTRRRSACSQCKGSFLPSLSEASPCIHLSSVSLIRPNEGRLELEFLSNPGCYQIGNRLSNSFKGSSCSISCWHAVT